MNHQTNYSWQMSWKAAKAAKNSCTTSAHYRHYWRCWKNVITNYMVWIPLVHSGS